MKFHHHLLLITTFALLGCDAPIEPDRPPRAAEPSVAIEGEVAGLAPALAPEAPLVAAILPRRERDVPRPTAGLVTAGDIDDALNYREFVSYARNAQRETKLPFANFGRPVLAKVTGPQGAPAPGVRATLRRPGAAAPFYDGYTGVDGMITVFPAAFGVGNLRQVELRLFPNGAAAPVQQIISTGGDRSTVTLPAAQAANPDFLDLMFVVDATGSMADELAFLTKEMQSIVNTAAATVPDVDIRYGLVMYRDEGDDYVVRPYDFTGSTRQMRRQLRAQSAQGGGDYPEAAADALLTGVNMAWRRGRGERLLFHIADAPPHDEDAGRYLSAAQTAAQNNIQIFGLGASGVAKESEFLMRQAAVQTNGRYMFLTDDSGIGNRHAEPTVSCYQVTALKSLLIRTLQSELTGLRVEAPEDEIVRTVGTYQNGVCLN